MARTIVGIVVSDKADKTIVLKNTERKTHPLYKKQYSVSTKYIAHDENNEAHVGDKVKVKEVRPISKRKTLTLVEVLNKAAMTADQTVESVTAKDEGSEATIQEKKAEKAEAKKAEKDAEQQAEAQESES